MFAPRALAVILGVVLISGTGVFSQDKKDKDTPKSTAKEAPVGKIRGFLPPNWGKLGLSDDQKQSIYRIQAKYKEEIQELEDRIEALKATRQKEMDRVLTADQRKKLIQLVTGGKGD